MSISSPGIGSGLDVNSIVSQLMQVEQQPLIQLSQKEASYQSKLSAFGNLKGALSSFQTAVQGLSDKAKFQAVRTNVADSTVATTTADATAVPGNYALEVTKLAQAQKLAAAGQTSASAAIGVGTVSFDFGTISGGTFDSTTGHYTAAGFSSAGSGVKTVVINSTSNSLAGIRDAINQADIGVAASIVNDGGTAPYRLVLTSAQTGKASSMKISVAGDAALGALLNHDPAGSQALAENITAQNASFTVDGVAVSKPTNTATDVIPGVTLSLAKMNPGTPTTIAVVRDASTITGSVGQFVYAYNQINQTLKDLSAFDPNSKTGAILNGDAAVRSIQTQIRSVLTSTVTGGTSALTLLSQVGVTFQKDGTLAVDNAKLATVTKNNFDDIASVFAAVGKTSDSLVAYTGTTSKTTPGAYALSVTQLATQGQATGSASAGLTITAGSNDTLQVILDGVTTTVTLAPGTYGSAAALAAEVQSKINGAAAFSGVGSTVTVTQSAGVLILTSNRYGSSSAVDISGGNGKSGLVGTPVATAGVDVAGSINSTPATGAGQFLSGATGDAAEGLKVQVTGGGTGARGTINYSQGYASQLSKLAGSLLGTSGTISSRTDGIQATLKTIANDKTALNTRLTDLEKQYRAKFTALDVAMSNLSKTSSFLTQQLAILSKSSS